MMKKMHFVSGLPRSGSTLLAALLRQNPRLLAGVTSPLSMLCGTMLKSMSGSTEFAQCFDEERRSRIFRGMFDSYYWQAQPDSVVFDTNRAWTSRMSLIAKLYPQSRVICCVREPSWIIDSIEQALNRNPTELSRVFNFQQATSVYARGDFLMHAEKGLVGQAWMTLREAWFGNEAKRLIVVPYDQLANTPRTVLQQLYFELKEPEFEHDFEHVEFDATEYDATLGMPGLHSVREKVEVQPRQPSIPPDLFNKYANMDFWTKPEANLRGVCVLGQAYGREKVAVAH